ncbi:hypothetical protein M997_2002 [Proteus hauseri ATCC 700826]|uniref:Uncharacterized protein n=1 Tax=Proteus hauseri ATCC 700826 TaxID=1354271 RepID=A0AAJ3HRV6_PROHU|nr:hypothetical protein [Proteus hauseri]OAT46521.1 hypothetical protein M997_2002 [Proteus hauseri ATCC 700826]
MKISNASISQKKINKLANNSPSSVMSIWEKIKDWFGLSQEKKVLTLIYNIYFNQEATILEKSRDFFSLKKLAGEQYKNEFKHIVDGNDIQYIIDFKDSSILFRSDITPFIENIKNELNFDLQNESNKFLEIFINDYYDKKNYDAEDYKKKVISFRTALMKHINKKKNYPNEKNFSLDIFEQKKSFNDKYNYLKENSEKYSVSINKDKLIEKLYNPLSLDKQIELRKQVEVDIPRCDLKYDDENITDINSLESKLALPNEKDIILIFELIHQGIFPIIKDSFDKYEPIASMYSAFTGKTSIDIKNNEGVYVITINNKKEIKESDIEKLIQLSNFILNDFDYDSMKLYIENFIDDPITKEKVDAALEQYKIQIMEITEDSIGDKFNYKKNRFLLLEEEINVKFEFNPSQDKGLTISTDESKVEYSLLKS